jgi:hypothetical protein
MTRLKLLIVVASAIGLVQVATASTIIPGDASFEGYNTSSFAYGVQMTATKGVMANTPVAGGWTFGPSGGSGASYTEAGIAHTGVGSTDHWWFTPADDGKQAALLTQTGSFWQSIGGFDAGTATVSFYAEGRPYSSGKYGHNPIQVSLDSTVLTFGVSDATSITPSDTSMDMYTTNPITVTGGAHTLTFSGLATSGYLSSLIDAVSITNTPAPEPSVLILLSTALISLVAYAWRKRR